MIAGLPSLPSLMTLTAVRDDGRATGQHEELAEVARLDHVTVFDARESDGTTAPRIVEVAVADILDHDRDAIIREDEVAVLPRDESRRDRWQIRRRMRPARASVALAPRGSG